MLYWKINVTSIFGETSTYLGKHFDLIPLFNQPPNAKDEKQRERHGKKYLIVVSCDRGISASL